MRDDVGSRLLREAGLERLTLEDGVLRLGGIQRTQQAFAVAGFDQCAGTLAFLMDGIARGAALLGDVGVRRAAAILEGADDVGRIMAVLEGHILQAQLTLKRSGRDGGIEPGKALSSRQLPGSGGALDSGIDAAKALTHGGLRSSRLHELVTADGTHIGAQTGQRVHQEKLAVRGAPATATIVAPAIAVPARADSATDGTANQRAEAAAHTRIAAEIDNRLKTFHSSPH